MVDELKGVSAAVAEGGGQADESVTNGEPAGAEELREAAAHGDAGRRSRPTIEIIQLGSIVILARLIAPEEFGRYAIALIAQEWPT